MKKFITFCVAVAFGTMLFNSPVMSEASKVPPEMGVDESQDKELMDEQKKNEGSGTKKENTPPVTPESKPIIQKWPGFFDCGPSEVIMGIVNGKYKELPMLQMDGILQIPGGRTIGAPTVIYFNQDKNTFTVVTHFNNGFSCIILYGHNVGPASGNPAMNPGVQKKQYFDQEKPPKEFKIDKKEFKWRGTGHTDILVRVFKYFNSGTLV